MTEAERPPRPLLAGLAPPGLLFALFALALLGGPVAERLAGRLSARLLQGADVALEIGFWLAAGWLLDRFFSRVVWERAFAHAFGCPPPRLLTQLTRVLILILTVSAIVGIVFDQPVTGIWATSGLVGLGLAMAMRNVVMDTVSGVALHMERPFKVGEWIRFYQRRVEYIGRVEEINWRSTRLWTTERNMVVVPNSVMTALVLTNFSQPSKISRFELIFTLDFSVPADRAVRVLHAGVSEAIGDDGPLADPPPKVRVTGVGDNGMDYFVRYFLDPARTSPNRARNTVIRCVATHVRNAGMTLSYPKLDLYQAQMPWRQKEWAFPKDRVWLLARISLFESLDAEDLAFIGDNLIVHHQQAGRAVFEQGEAGSSMFILSEGLLEVTIHRADQPGEAVRVAQIAPGAFFGEMSLLTGEPRSATIRCVIDAVVCEITKETMETLFRRNPQVPESISRVVARRQARNSDAFQRQTPQDQVLTLERETRGFLTRIRTFFR